MLNSLYTYRTFLSLPVFIFAGQAAYSIHQGRPISGSVLGAMALLALILILFVIYKHDGTIFNKTTLSIMIYTVLGTCLYLGILVLFANF